MRSRQYLLNDMDVIVVLHPDSVKEFRAANWLQAVAVMTKRFDSGPTTAYTACEACTVQDLNLQPSD
jgi:hypothetical protein